MAATTTGLFARPAVRRAASETEAESAAQWRSTEFPSTDSPAPSGEPQGFGDADYHLLRSHTLLERLEEAISAKMK